MGDEPKRKPLFSTRANDPAIRESLDDFVVGLGERIDSLQDAEIAADLVQLGALVGKLRRDADAIGYGPLAECAAGVEAACAEGDAGAVAKGLVDLTQIAYRVRLGHRGAV